MIMVLPALGGTPEIGLAEVDLAQQGPKIGEGAIDAVIDEIDGIRPGLGQAKCIQRIAPGAEVVANIAPDQDGGAAVAQEGFVVLRQLAGIRDKHDGQPGALQAAEKGAGCGQDAAGSVEMYEERDIRADGTPGHIVSFDDLVRGMQKAKRPGDGDAQAHGDFVQHQPGRLDERKNEAGDGRPQAVAREIACGEPAIIRPAKASHKHAPGNRLAKDMALLARLRLVLFPVVKHEVVAWPGKKTPGRKAVS